MEETKYAPDRLFGKKSDDGITVLIFVILFLTICISVYSYFFAIIRVSGDSMLDTLTDEQFILFRTNAIKIARNDIVTINIEKANKVLIKRVVATEGDKVLFMYAPDGFYVDLYLCKKGENSFSLCDEPYIRQRMTREANYGEVIISQYVENLSELSAETIENYIEIPEACFYYLGDNRNISQDAREYGIQNISQILGKAYLYIKPNSFPDRILSFYYSLFTQD